MRPPRNRRYEPSPPGRGPGVVQSRPCDPERVRTDRRRSDRAGEVLRLLHRHHGLHRLQGLRGGVQGVEQPARRPDRPDRTELRQHGRAIRQHLAPRQLHREDGRAGGAHRHRDAVPVRLADDERRVQALPQPAVHGGVPDRLAVQDRVRHGGRAAGHLQRLRLLRARLPVRRDRHLHDRRQGAQVHPLLRPAEGRAGAGLRQELPHRLHPVRRGRRPGGARQAARRAPP